MTDLQTLFNKIVKEIEEKEMNNVWKTGKYGIIRNLEIDKRGSVGERFFQRVFTNSAFGRRVEYKDGDQDDWDLKINKIKLEIKTSSLTINKKTKNFVKNKFQNEGIKNNNKFDGILFLGVAPEDLYIKILKRENIPYSKLHSREDAKTGVGYKWDIKLEDMKLINNIDDIISEFKTVFHL